MHIHIIGIAGTMTAALAVELKNKGNLVTGSDQYKIYPPVSNLLKKANIPINTVPISKKIDFAIIGSSFSSFSNTKDEFKKIKELHIPYLSATEYIAKNICKKDSVLIAGTYGKTTITSLLTWILIKAGLNPSFMFGGDSVNKINPLKITAGQISIVEADESIHGLDKQAKFLYYPIKHLILTSAEWEHKDCYKNETENYNAFKVLINKLPKDGTLLINSQGYKTKELSQFSKAQIITYNTPQSDYYIYKKEINQNSSNIFIKTPNDNLELTTSLIGNFNFENILAAVSFSLQLGIEPQIIKKAISSFKGVRRRIELINKNNDIYFYDDFAQSTSRVESVIKAIKLHFPKNTIKVFFEPHASFLQNKNSILGFSHAFIQADEIILGKINFSNLDKNIRTTAADFKKEIGSKLIYLPIKSDIVKHYQETLKPHDILIHMSSGGYEGQQIFKQIINNFKKLEIRN